MGCPGTDTHIGLHDKMSLWKNHKLFLRGYQKKSPLYYMHNHISLHDKFETFLLSNQPTHYQDPLNQLCWVVHFCFNDILLPL